MNDDIFFSTIGELSAKLKGREISAEELARAFAGRLEKLGPGYNALALSLRDRGIDQAKEVDDQIKRERIRGPLQGIPFAVKDLLSVSGKPTTWGAKPYAKQELHYDATAVTKLEKAGACLIGKLAMVELAGGGGYEFPSASMFGPGLNPWDVTRWSGGSSSGSGSAVAAGLVPFALGSETWGSILTPAAYCGVTALRPTYGLVSRHGAMALSWTLDKIGPMCRSAEDCGIVLGAMAGGDSRDPGSAGKTFYYLPDFARKMEEIRIGIAPVDFEEWAEPATRPAFRQALAALRELRAPITETELPDFPYGRITGFIIDAEGSAIFEELIQSGKVDELADRKQIAGLKAGLDIKAKDYLKAMRVRRLAQDALRKLFIDFDVLVSPARLGTASKVDAPLSAPTGRPVPKHQGLSGLSAAGNLAGLPALVVPCGFAEGLPVALQLVGRPFTESTLIALGREFQKQTDWHRKRPPVAAA
ncbi:MAG TPA: amidase [Bryobacteraceae bacterium]|nr:amidase [Bryobacteraceae bacterium]